MWRMVILAAVLSVARVASAEDLTNVQWSHCHDGDTCTFNVLLPAVFGKDIGVRMTGIDTPEIDGHCAKEKRKAKEAQAFLTAHFKAAKSIVLKNVFRDKYFRIEAIVMVDGVNLNALMVEKGYAVVYAGAGLRFDWCMVQ